MCTNKHDIILNANEHEFRFFLLTFRGILLQSEVTFCTTFGSLAKVGVLTWSSRERTLKLAADVMSVSDIFLIFTPKFVKLLSQNVRKQVPEKSERGLK